MPVISYEEAAGFAQPQRKVISYEEAANPGYLEDIAKSGVAGLARGVIGMQGLPGDAEGLLKRGATWALDKVGLPHPDLNEQPSLLPTSKGITQTVEGVTGKLHEPQTVPGEYARTIGEFAPAVIGGPEGILGKVAATVIPAVASETAGQVTKGTSAEPMARVGGALLGGVGTAAASAPRAARAIAPNTEELKTAASQAYKQADNAGLTVSVPSFQRMVMGSLVGAKRAGLDRSLHPKATAALGRLAEAADSGKPQTLQDMDTLRQIVKDAAASVDPGERRIAQILVGRLDDYLGGLTTKDVVAGDAKAAVSAVREARGLWARMRKSEKLDDLMERALNRVGRNYTQAELQTALRQEYSSLANNKKAMRGFTKEEQGEIRRVVRGGTAENLLRLLGKFAPRGNLGTILSAGAGYGVGGPVGAVGLPVAGEVAKRVSGAMGMKRVNRLTDLVRSGKASAVQPPFSPVPVGSGLAATVPWREDQ